MYDKIIQKRLMFLDDAIKQLSKSDSSIEYANHIRNKFDDVVLMLNELKLELGVGEIVENIDWYFN